MLSATTQFIVDLFLLMGSAVIAGELVTHLGQPALVGQLLVGILLGPTLLGGFAGLVNQGIGIPSLTLQLSSLQILATIFILFMAGLEVVPEQIYRMRPSTIGMGLAVFFVPFVGAALVVPLVEPGLSAVTDLYVALTLSITALPVMGIMLSEFGLLRSKMGNLLMGTALVNELTAVTVFAVLLGISSSGYSGTRAVLVALVSVGLFIASMLLVHMVLRLLRDAKLWEPLVRGFSHTWRSKQGNFALLMVMVVGSTLFSQFLGLTYVVGAFYAGLLVTRQSAGDAAHRSISSIFDAMTWGFFVPLFFALVGVEMNLRVLLFSPSGAFSIALLLPFLALLTVAIVSKVAVGAGSASLLGWRDPDALAIGYMVGSRGAVELAMATILYQSNLIDVQLFTVIAGVGLITTILAPIGAMRTWLSDPQSKEELYLRLPSLRKTVRSYRALRPPMSWDEMRELYQLKPLVGSGAVVAVPLPASELASAWPASVPAGPSGAVPEEGPSAPSTPPAATTLPGEPEPSRPPLPVRRRPPSR